MHKESNNSFLYAAKTPYQEVRFRTQIEYIALISLESKQSA